MFDKVLNTPLTVVSNTAQNMKFSIKDFIGKCDQIHRKLRIWSHLLRKSVMENFIFVECNGPASTRIEKFKGLTQRKVKNVLIFIPNTIHSGDLSSV